MNIVKHVLTFDPKILGVLLHGCLISQDYGPPQFTKGLSVSEVKSHSCYNTAIAKDCQSFLF